MIVFNVDLDNTLIYSYKHDIGSEKRNVELYQGREISFITEKTHELLTYIKEKLLFVPTSTRTTEQYKRINLGIGNVKYALVCNGGLLLKDGSSDEEWYQESRRLIQDSEAQLEQAYGLLELDPRREFELRLIEDLFLFTKCSCPEQVVEDLKRMLDLSKVDVFHNGTKVYVVPGSLSKGKAIQRFQKYIGAEQILAAGDSEFDISMLQAADCGFAPHGFMKKYSIKGDIKEVSGESVFAEELLTLVLEYMKGASM